MSLTTGLHGHAKNYKSARRGERILLDRDDRYRVCRLTTLHHVSPPLTDMARPFEESLMTIAEQMTPTPLRVQKRQADELMKLWMRLSQCGQCNALLDVTLPCPVCRHQVDLSPTWMIIDGKEHIIPAATQGAVPWSMYVMLRQIQMDLHRPMPSAFKAQGSGTRVMVPLMFWVMFEIMMDAFMRSALANHPDSERLLKQPYIGGRIDKLYRDCWGLTFWKDLERIEAVEAARTLQRLQDRRNAFIHGDPEAIDDVLVSEVMTNSATISLSWIQLFNERATGSADRHKLWHSERRRGV